MQYQHITIPIDGEAITVTSDGHWNIPERPIIAFIEGDGVGGDITPMMRKVVDAAIASSYQNARKIEWMQVYNGEKAAQLYDGDWFPQETIHAVRQFKIAIKGPLTTPIGGGFRSLNVALRQEMDLFVNMRPVRSYANLPSPLKNPEKTNMVVFRDSSEDIYSGVEWQAGSVEAEKVLDFLCHDMGVTRLRFDSQCGIGIKNISQEGSARLMRHALNYALAQNSESLTVVHKGNVLKFTDGAFKRWSFEVAKQEFGAVEHVNGRWLQIERPAMPPLLIKEVIADNMLQQALIKPEDFDVIVTTNQNGDYLADMLTAQVGGIGILPAANLNQEVAFFEPTHGTFSRIAGKNMANPTSSILSGVMMLRFMNWHEAADSIEQALSQTLKAAELTFDLHQDNESVTYHEEERESPIILSCSEFADKIIGRLA